MRAKILLAALTVLALTASPAHAQSKPWVFMLAGQSNMVGQGFPVPVQQPDGRIMRQGAVGAPQTVAQDPLGGAGAGPAMPFARELLKHHPGVRIVLVPCAKSGSYITQWQHGSRNYNRCVTRTRAAIRHGGEFKGILFAQGESDAFDMAHGTRWAERYQRTIRGFRKSLSAPTVPIVHTVIHPVVGFPASEIVQAQQRRHLNSRDAAVEAQDLELRDAYHYTVPGYGILGRRMAQAWMG